MTKERLPLALGILGAGAIAAVVLHLLAGTTFPSPWPDEIDFMTPAAQLARHFTLSAPQLSAPHGMFWEPELMYFVWAPVLRFAPLAVESARWVSLALLIAAAGGFFAAGRRAGVPPIAGAAAAALFLVTPEAIAGANIARPETMVLAFVAWSAAATMHDRRVLALSLAAFACVSHSAGVPFALVLAVPNLLRRTDRPPTRRSEWAVAGVAAAFVVFQALHLLLNASVALDQLRFQAQVHSHVTHGNRGPYVEAAAVLTLSLLLLRRRLEWRALVLGALAVAGIAVLFIGWEMWYEIYAVDLAPLLVAYVAIVALRGAVTSTAVARVTAALVVVLFALFAVPATTTPGFEGMQLRRYPDEWHAFERRVTSELRHIDRMETSPTVVVLNDVSGLPWPLRTDRVGRHLRMVKETLVTRAQVTPQISLFTPGHRQPPHGRRLATITSPHHVFTAIFVDLR
ncbi:MAG TPA: hypothetical protein VHC63_10125 [Acidimicrobiales bacterium]|nr:hypothetical protein [Acidimicrobiales bacterium]